MSNDTSKTRILEKLLNCNYDNVFNSWLYIHTLCNNYNANDIASPAPTPMGAKLKGARQIYKGTLLINNGGIIYIY